MKIKELKTIKSPKAIGPYSQGILFNNLIFTSGQIPLNPQTGQLVKNCNISNNETSCDNTYTINASLSSSKGQTVYSECIWKESDIKGSCQLSNTRVCKLNPPDLPPKNAKDIDYRDKTILHNYFNLIKCMNIIIY